MRWCWLRAWIDEFIHDETSRKRVAWVWVDKGEVLIPLFSVFKFSFLIFFLFGYGALQLAVDIGRYCAIHPRLRFTPLPLSFEFAVPFSPLAARSGLPFLSAVPVSSSCVPVLAVSLILFTIFFSRFSPCCRRNRDGRREEWRSRGMRNGACLSVYGCVPVWECLLLALTLTPVLYTMLSFSFPIPAFAFFGLFPYSVHLLGFYKWVLRLRSRFSLPFVFPDYYYPIWNEIIFLKKTRT